ncbi:MAG TPA: DUF3299 domain-containing protein [Pirellulales bacterium]
MNAQTRLTILAAPLLATLLLCAAGCADRPAPAMTQAAKAAKQVAQPAATTGSPTDLAADSKTASDAPATDEAGAAPSPAATQAAPVPAEKPAAESSNRLRDISFDDLKFDMNKGDPFERSLLTGKIEALGGQRVRLRGFILPSFQQTGLTQFVLVRDNLSCCFGPGAAIYDCVIVEMKPGNSTDYSLYPVAVDGTFTIREMLDPDGKAVAIYHLDGEQVR